MKKQKTIIRLSLFLTLLLLVAAVSVGCGENKNRAETAETAYTFAFTVTFEDGTTESREITTNHEFVGAALENEGLIAGEMSKYGLSVHTVCGITFDFNKDNKYWAVYVDGEYALSGVDTIKCADIKEVGFKVESF